MTPTEIQQAIENILAQPAEAFPFVNDPPDSGTALALQSIGRQLGMDPRAAYADGAIDMDDLLYRLSKTERPDNVAAADWTTVTNQLSTEMSDVSNVRTLLSNINSFFNSLFLDRGARLSHVSGLVKISGSTSVGFNLLSALSAALGALSYFPVGSEVNSVAGLFALTVNMMNQSGNAGDISAQVTDLWGELQNDFDAGLSQIGGAFTKMVTDWGRLQAISNLIENGTLSWPLDTGEMLAKAGMAYELVIWKTLVPYVWAICSTGSAGWKLSGKGICVSCTYLDPAGIPYWITLDTYGMWWSPPSQEMCDRLFNPPSQTGDTGGLGVDKSALVFNNDGWNLNHLPATQGEPEVPSCVHKK